MCSQHLCSQHSRESLLWNDSTFGVNFKGRCITVGTLAAETSNVNLLLHSYTVDTVPDASHTLNHQDMPGHTVCVFIWWPILIGAAIPAWWLLLLPPPPLPPPLSPSLNTSASSFVLYSTSAVLLFWPELRRPLSVRLSAGDPEFSSNMTSRCSLPLISLSSPSHSPLSALLRPAFCSPFTSSGEDRGLGAAAAGGPDQRLWSHGDLRKATDGLLALIISSLQTRTCGHTERVVYRTANWVTSLKIPAFYFIRLFRFHDRSALHYIQYRPFRSIATDITLSSNLLLPQKKNHRKKVNNCEHKIWNLNFSIFFN